MLLLLLMLLIVMDLIAKVHKVFVVHDGQYIVTVHVMMLLQCLLLLATRWRCIALLLLLNTGGGCIIRTRIRNGCYNGRRWCGRMMRLRLHWLLLAMLLMR